MVTVVLSFEEKPRLAGFAGDVAVTVEGGVCELVLARILPDVLGAVAFGRIARQPQKMPLAVRHRNTTIGKSPASVPATA